MDPKSRAGNGSDRTHAAEALHPEAQGNTLSLSRLSFLMEKQEGKSCCPLKSQYLAVLVAILEMTVTGLNQPVLGLSDGEQMGQRTSLEVRGY